MATIRIAAGLRIDFDQRLNDYQNRQKVRPAIHRMPTQNGPDLLGRLTYFGVPDPFVDELVNEGFELERISTG